MESKTPNDPVHKNLLNSVLIVKVSNGYIVYEDESEYRNSNGYIGSVNQRRVFETKANLFEFLNKEMY